MIVCDPKNPVALRFRDELLERLPEGVPDRAPHVVIGGDGFLLHTIADLGFDGSYLGLNAGRVGFLLNDVESWDAMSWDVVAHHLRNREWTVHRFPLIQARVELLDGEEVHLLAINDIYLERGTGQTTHLALTIDGHLLVDLLASDGVIFSTALGSTAYAFSAGGPACHPTLQIMTVTPICPHRPRLSAFALPSTSRVHVDVLSPERRKARVVADSRVVTGIRSVDVFYGPETVRLAFLPEHDFTRAMVSKILKP